MQDGKTPLDMAENEEVKALLREHGGKLSFLGTVEKGMLEEVSEWIKEGADVNQQEVVINPCLPAGHQQLGKTPLHYAVKREEAVTVVAMLLDSKAAVDAVDQVRREEERVRESECTDRQMEREKEKGGERGW